MQKNKLFLGILLVTFGLLLSACSSIGGSQNALPSFGSGSSESGSGGSSSSTTGVVLSFGENNPPSEMYKGQNYNFNFFFENHLSVAVENLEVQTRGFDRGFVSGLDRTYSVSRIPPANDLSGPGVFSGLVVSNVRVTNFDSASYSFDPSFEYCYKATTQFREQVCVPSVNNICEEKVDSSRNQNGPVAVSVGSIDVVGNEILIPITLENRGKGDVVNNCFDTNEPFERDIKINTIRLGSQSGSCESISSENDALINGEATFLCSFSRTQDESYGSQISVEFEYLYEQSVEKDITVIDPRAGIVS
jgi:hypothetical protein